MTTQTQPAPSPSFYNASTASTNPTLVSGSPCSVGQVDVSNTSAAAVYLKLFNLNRVPVPATDIPVVTIPVAAGTTSIINFGALAKRFSIGFGYALTGAMADGDTTAVALGVKVSGTYAT